MTRPDPLEVTQPREKVRTHLANERTFLAWSRTGLTTIALGLGAAQLLEKRHVGDVALNQLLAATLVLFGLVLVLVGRWRYRQTALGIRDDDWRPHRRMLEVVLLGTLLVAGVSIIFILRG